jgi:hypothetical protein
MEYDNRSQIQINFQKIIMFLQGLSKEELINKFDWVKFPSEDAADDTYRFNILEQVPFEKLQEIVNKELIQIGDEVEINYAVNDFTKGYVTKIDGDYVWILFADGSHELVSEDLVKKTGRTNHLVVYLMRDLQKEEEEREALAEEMGIKL